MSLARVQPVFRRNTLHTLINLLKEAKRKGEGGEARSMCLLLALCVLGVGAATDTATSMKGPRQIRKFAKLAAPASLNQRCLAGALLPLEHLDMLL